MYKILTNKCMCRVCGSIIESKHRHDFVFCKCGAIAVDGGKDYLKRMGERHHIVEMSQHAKCKNCGEYVKYLSKYSQPDHPLITKYSSNKNFYGLWYCSKCQVEYGR